MFFRLTRLGNPSRANLRDTLVIFMTHKVSPYKANLRACRGCYTVHKDNPITLQVNLSSLTLWSNQGNLKHP